MNLQVPWFSTAVAPDTHVKTVFVPPCAALKGLAAPPEQNSWCLISDRSILSILIISLAEDFKLGGFFTQSLGPAAVFVFLCFYVLRMIL
jgi:hypothetical protein